MTSRAPTPPLAHHPICDEIPVVDAGVRRIVLGTLWTLTTGAIVAWRISDGLPVIDGIVAGVGLASWPWLMVWLLRQQADAADELDAIGRAWGRR